MLNMICYVISRYSHTLATLAMARQILTRLFIFHSPINGENFACLKNPPQSNLVLCCIQAARPNPLLSYLKE